MTINKPTQRHPVPLLAHLELAADARRCGDHAAAETHELAALVMGRAVVAAARVMQGRTNV